MDTRRIEHTAEEMADIPEPFLAHVPTFEVAGDGPGCDCCGAGSCWCVCACGRRSPRFSCAQQAADWHLDHVVRALTPVTVLIAT